MKIIQPIKEHNSLFKVSSEFPENLLHSIKPTLILDVQIRIIGEDSTKQDFSSFLCQHCRERDYDNCKRKSIVSRLQTLNDISMSSKKFVQINLNNIDKKIKIISPCEKFFFFIKEGYKLPNKLRYEYLVLLMFTSTVSHQKRQKTWVTNLDFLCKRYRNWLLSKFKQNYTDLGKEEKFKSFSLEKLNTLQGFCKFSGVKYDSLKFTPNNPPSLVYKNCKKKKVFKKNQMKKDINKSKELLNKSIEDKISLSTKSNKNYSKNLISITNKTSNPISIEKQLNKSLKQEENKFNFPFGKKVSETKGNSYNNKSKTINSNLESQKLQTLNLRKIDESLNPDFYDFSQQQEEDSHYTPSHLISKHDKTEEVSEIVEAYSEIRSSNIPMIQVDTKSGEKNEKIKKITNTKEINLTESKAVSYTHLTLPTTPYV